MQISWWNAGHGGLWFVTPTTRVYKRPQGSREVHILQAKALLSPTSSTIDKMSYYYGNYYGSLGYGLDGLGYGCGYGCGFGGYGYVCYRPCYYGRYFSSDFYWETLHSTSHMTENFQPIFLFLILPSGHFIPLVPLRWNYHEPILGRFDRCSDFDIPGLTW